jgi:hypothetical protein
VGRREEQPFVGSIPAHAPGSATIRHRVAVPQAPEDFDRLFHALAAVIAAPPVVDESIFVVDGSVADADIDPALTEVVERASWTLRRTGWWNDSCTTAKPIAGDQSPALK